MPGKLQPLDQKFQIVGPDGRPTLYFIKWAQQRQIDITDGITLQEAQQLIDEWSAGRSIIAGVALDGGGTLDADVTIDHADTANDVGTFGDATHSARVTVNAQGHVTDIEEVPISGGGGGGGVFAPWTIPLIADFTTINLDSITLTDNPNGIVFNNPSGMPFETRGLLKPVPGATPWNAYARVDMGLIAGEGNWRCGLTLQNSGTGRLQQFGMRGDGNSLHLVDIVRWNSATSYSGEDSRSYYSANGFWIRVENDGTNLNMYLGDGYNWRLVYTTTIAAWLVAVTHAGMTLQSGQNSILSFNSFSFTAPAAGGGGPA